MQQSFYYPLNLALHGKNCLIFGFGSVGKRKFKGLLSSSPASILILDLHSLPDLSFAQAEILSYPTQIFYLPRSWREEDLLDKFLVFACSSDKSSNRALSDLCQSKNILCNNVSDPQLGTFILPASIKLASLSATISTAGASPLLAARIKNELENWLMPKAIFVELLKNLRPIVLKQNFYQEKNKKIFSSILDSSIPNWLAEGNYSACHLWLRDNFPFIDKSELDKIFINLQKCFPHT